MPRLECAVADSLIKPMAAPPLLSIVVPTHNRAAELPMTLGSLANQLTDGLETKVEIVISDNGSDAGTVEVIRALTDRYPSMNYVLNARDEGGFFNFFAAPWRARGQYTWVFGSDDLLIDGGIVSVLGILERERPSFLTLNKRLVNSDLTEAIWERANTVPTRRFDRFTDLFAALGVNQFAFISAQIESTEAARALDAEPYLRTESRHPHVAAYLEKHAHSPGIYSEENHLVHRADNSPLLEYHSGNFYDYAITLPRLLLEVMERAGVSPDLLERITGEKRISSYDPPRTTFVDSMMENMLRALGSGRQLTVGHQRMIEGFLAEHGRADRLTQFAEIWSYNMKLIQLMRQEEAAKAQLAHARQVAFQTSTLFTGATNE